MGAIPGNDVAGRSLPSRVRATAEGGLGEDDFAGAVAEARGGMSPSSIAARAATPDTPADFTVVVEAEGFAVSVPSLAATGRNASMRSNVISTPIRGSGASGKSRRPSKPI
jgi:hypothetical protein